MAEKCAANPEFLGEHLQNLHDAARGRAGGSSSALAKQLADEKRKSPNDKKPKYIPVVAIVNGCSTRTTLVPAGAGRYRLQIDAMQRKAANADTGDVIRVELHLDLASRAVPVPADLKAGLRSRPKAWKAFESAPPGFRRQFIKWFDCAKGLDARRRRLDRAIDVLLERTLLSPRTQAKPKKARHP